MKVLNLLLVPELLPELLLLLEHALQLLLMLIPLLGFFLPAAAEVRHPLPDLLVLFRELLPELLFIVREELFFQTLTSPVPLFHGSGASI